MIHEMQQWPILNTNNNPAEIPLDLFSAVHGATAPPPLKLTPSEVMK